MATHAERRKAGTDLLAEMTGRGGAFAQGAELRGGAFGSYVVDYVFGQMWQGEELNRRDRNLVALAMLGALDRFDAVRFHASFGPAEWAGARRDRRNRAADRGLFGIPGRQRDGQRPPCDVERGRR